ncbi:hypothetical protein [Nocardioides aequoreus]|uniref:hypothetical protein n=1 Tax=Nocardioides aequoreus TaxID=397278 RepID=UPI0004C30A5E|nr:hypothetical protein [Nocardioides aequoreus]
MTTARPTAVLLGGLAAFQAGLAVGAPWGRAAYGGQHPGPLPTRLRTVSGVASAAYAAAALALAADGTSEPVRRRLLRGVVGLVGTGTLVNAASRSPVERAVWTPYCAVTGALALRALRG